jgi:hypothetical protein
MQSSKRIPSTTSFTGTVSYNRFRLAPCADTYRKRLDPRHGCCECYKEEEVERTAYTDVDFVVIDIRLFVYGSIYSGKGNRKMAFWGGG